MDPLILIAVIALLVLVVLYVGGRIKAPPTLVYQWKPVPTPDCMYPTPQGLCKQPYHLEV
jgi:hypothetical protein